MPLAHYQGYVENVSTGKALGAAVIRVYTYPGNILQAVFADLSSTPKATVLTDANGAYDFYIADGNYDIEYVFGGVVLTRLINVPIMNPVNYPITASVTPSLFLQSGVAAVTTTTEVALRKIPVTLEEFGGGVGVADNTAALKAALKTGRPLHLKCPVPFALAVYNFASPIDFGAINVADGVQIPSVHIFGDGMGKVRLKYTGVGVAMIGGLSAPAAGGYKQTFVFHDFDYYGNGRVDATGVVPSAAFTYQRFVTTPNVFSGSNSTQTGLFLELDGGSHIYRCHIAGWQTALRTKKGYSAVIELNLIDYNQIGLELTQDVTTVTIRNNDIFRNSINIALWQTQKIVIEGNAIQAAYSGCDIYSFAQNRQIKIADNYFEASLECLVQDGDATTTPANNNMNWEIIDNKALKVRITEGAFNWNFRRNAMAVAASPVGLASKPSFIVGTNQTANIFVFDNVHNDDMKLRFTDYTGTGAVNLVKFDGYDGSMFRATGAFAPASGPGLEVIYSEGQGQLTAYDRTGFNYLPIRFNGATVSLAPNGSALATARTTGLFLSAGALGYEAGAGGAVTQATSKTTGVTLNKASGAITMNNAALAANTGVAFRFNNSLIGANDTVVVSIKQGGTSLAYVVGVEAVVAGYCDIALRNVSAGSLPEALVLNFAVIKGAVT